MPIARSEGADGAGSAGEPVVRHTARVVPVNEDGAALMLLDQNPDLPGVLRWGTIGGAIDEGETLEQAVVREMFEETGIRIDEASLVGPFHSDRRDFTYGGVHYVGDATFFAMPLAGDVEVSFEHLEAAEVGNVFEARWLTTEELAADGRMVAPTLPEVLRRAVDLVRGTDDGTAG
ncbi:MAG: hypothetical protein CMH83_21895 [Nocardioides sp.]|nr:hypothetical protein [Nocardioides sp.]